jgi:hypothetical protein
MTLPASGAISLNDVNVELGFSGTALINMNDNRVRALFNLPNYPLPNPTTQIDMNTGHGKTDLTWMYTRDVYCVCYDGFFPFWQKFIWDSVLIAGGVWNYNFYDTETYRYFMGDYVEWSYPNEYEKIARIAL